MKRRAQGKGRGGGDADKKKPFALVYRGLVWSSVLVEQGPAVLGGKRFFGPLSSRTIKNLTARALIF